MRHAQATAPIHPAFDELRTATLAARQRLARALAIETDWRYHDGPEWAARYWRAFGDLAVPHDNPAEQIRYQRVTRRNGWPPLKAGEADDLRTIFRALLAMLHPAVDPTAGSDARTGLWRQVRQAYRCGDRRALIAAWSDTRALVRGSRLPHDVVALRIEHDRLRTAADAADRRLAGMSGQFPFNLRNKLDDPQWLHEQRVALRQIHVFTQPPARPQRADAPRHKRVS